MATLTIRNLPEEVRRKLRLRAARSGRSMEAEVRALLTTAVDETQPPPLRSVDERVARLQAAFAPYRSAEGSLADELIAERRIEGWRENLEALQDLRTGRTVDRSQERK